MRKINENRNTGRRTIGLIKLPSGRIDWTSDGLDLSSEYAKKTSSSDGCFCNKMLKAVHYYIESYENKVGKIYADVVYVDGFRKDSCDIPFVVEQEFSVTWISDLTQESQNKYPGLLGFDLHKKEMVKIGFENL